MTFLAELLRPIGHLIFKVAVLFGLLFARVITAAFFLLFIVPVLSISWAYSFFQISKTHSNDTDYEQDKTVEGIQGVHGVRITICRTDEVSDFELDWDDMDSDTVKGESGEWEGRGGRKDDILMGQESESRARDWVDGVTHDA
jgi:hypothetical protein